MSNVKRRKPIIDGADNRVTANFLNVTGVVFVY